MPINMYSMFLYIDIYIFQFLSILLLLYYSCSRYIIYTTNQRLRKSIIGTLENKFRIVIIRKVSTLYIHDMSKDVPGAPTRTGAIDIYI